MTAHKCMNLWLWIYDLAQVHLYEFKRNVTSCSLRGVGTSLCKLCVSSVLCGRSCFGTDTSRGRISSLCWNRRPEAWAALECVPVPKEMISKAVRSVHSQRTYAHLCRCLQLCLESAQDHVRLYVVFIPRARFIAKLWCGGGWHWRSGCLAAAI